MDTDLDIDPKDAAVMVTIGKRYGQKNVVEESICTSSKESRVENHKNKTPKQRLRK